jgi:hypothetical protein
MPKRNIAQELHDMGIQDDEAEWHELEARDAEHQEKVCREQHHKEIQDYMEWKRRMKPKGLKRSHGIRCRGLTSVGPFVPVEHDQTK